MKLLLDTHCLFWAMLEDKHLSPLARTAIAAVPNEVFVSTASIWEMAIKVGIKKWPEAAELVANIEDELAEFGFVLLPISVAHVRRAGVMQSPYRDPFDRLLAAQALIEGLTLVTADAKVATLGAPVLW